MGFDDEAESIRKRMSELRRELSCDVRDVGRSARAMTNPSYYIRKFPWATMAVAAALGYLLIPRKKQVVQPDAKMLAELVKSNQVRVDTSKAAKDSKGLLETLAVMGISWAARAGLSYIGQRLTTASTNKAGMSPKSASKSPVDDISEVRH